MSWHTLIQYVAQCFTMDSHEHNLPLSHFTAPCLEFLYCLWCSDSCVTDAKCTISEFKFWKWVPFEIKIAENCSILPHQCLEIQPLWAVINMLYTVEYTHSALCTWSVIQLAHITLLVPKYLNIYQSLSWINSVSDSPLLSWEEQWKDQSRWMHFFSSLFDPQLVTAEYNMLMLQYGVIHPSHRGWISNCLLHIT